MTNPPPAPRGVPDDKSRVPPDAALGGADAVPDTHYVPHPGPERPKGDAHAHPPPAAAGPNATWAIIVFLAVGAVLVYLLGLGR
jgi:hypothetical protein